ncbi:hypothetical protein [Pseudomonas sp. W03]|uniref:hypothetical protein n=1 Tax=Pseudomonas sp. W03 TaxID=3090666 RepID=UPI003A4DE034
MLPSKTIKALGCTFVTQQFPGVEALEMLPRIWERFTKVSESYKTLGPVAYIDILSDNTEEDLALFLKYTTSNNEPIDIESFTANDSLTICTLVYDILLFTFGFLLENPDKYFTPPQDSEQSSLPQSVTKAFQAYSQHNLVYRILTSEVCKVDYYTLHNHCTLEAIYEMNETISLHQFTQAELMKRAAQQR